MLVCQQSESSRRTIKVDTKPTINHGIFFTPPLNCDCGFGVVDPQELQQQHQP